MSSDTNIETGPLNSDSQPTPVSASYSETLYDDDTFLETTPLKDESDPFAVELDATERLTIGAAGALALVGTVSYRGAKEQFSHYSHEAKELAGRVSDTIVGAAGALAITGTNGYRYAREQFSRYANEAKELAGRASDTVVSKAGQAQSAVSSFVKQTPGKLVDRIDSADIARVIDPNQEIIDTQVRLAKEARKAGNLAGAEKILKDLSKLIQPGERSRIGKMSEHLYTRPSLQTELESRFGEIRADVEAVDAGNVTDYYAPTVWQQRLKQRIADDKERASQLDITVRDATVSKLMHDAKLAKEIGDWPKHQKLLVDLAEELESASDMGVRSDTETEALSLKIDSEIEKTVAGSKSTEAQSIRENRAEMLRRQDELLDPGSILALQRAIEFKLRDVLPSTPIDRRDSVRDEVTKHFLEVHFGLPIERIEGGKEISEMLLNRVLRLLHMPQHKLIELDKKAANKKRKPRRDAA